MFLLILAIALWGIVHSFLASLPAKAFVLRTFGDAPARLYRLAYNVFSVITFIPILFLTRLPPDQTLYVVPPPWLYLTLLVQAVAAIALMAAVIQTGALAFVGLRQLASAPEQTGLVTSGFYRYVRHPMYLFGLVILWLIPVMTVNTLVLYTGLTLYLLVGAWFEERKLLAVFGTAYAQYRACTPMLIPFRFSATTKVPAGR
jgi:methanethiol S-methyltransferase